VKLQIGAYEAKTKLPELLRQVAAGQRFTITHRGRAVAELGPVGTVRPDAAAAVARFLEFKAANPRSERVDIRALLEAGRA